MDYCISINTPIKDHEVPELREFVGWDRRDEDYPVLFERCNFWGCVRNDKNELIGFGYVCGMGLEHGYMEDILIHPSYQRMGIGVHLVKALLDESEIFGLKIVTLTFEQSKSDFYKACGFTIGSGGVWESTK